MSISVSGSHHRIAAQLLKGLREDSGTTSASAGTTGAAGTASGSSIDSTGSTTSSAMMAFLARLSGSSESGSAADGGAGPDGTSATDAPPPGPPPGAGAAGTTGAAATSGGISVSSLIGALETVLQSMTVSSGTSGDASLSTGDVPPPPPADGPASTGRSDGTSAATAGQIQAFAQALQAYAAQASSTADS